MRRAARLRSAPAPTYRGRLAAAPARRAHRGLADLVTPGARRTVHPPSGSNCCPRVQDPGRAGTGNKAPAGRAAPTPLLPSNALSKWPAPGGGSGHDAELAQPSAWKIQGAPRGQKAPACAPAPAASERRKETVNYLSPRPNFASAPSVSLAEPAVLGQPWGSPARARIPNPTLAFLEPGFSLRASQP